MEQNKIIDEILKKIFSNNDIKEGYKALEEKLKSEKNKVELCNIILTKLNTSPFNEYLIKDSDPFKIHLYLFDKLRTCLYPDNEILFKILFSLFNIPASNEVNKLNIIIKKLKGEKLFIFKNYNKLLDSIVIPSLSKKDIAIQKEAYYLEQIIKEEIGILFQKEKKDKEDIEELNKGFDSIYYYFKAKLKDKTNLYLDKKEKKKSSPTIIFIISWLNFIENLPGKDLTEHYQDIIDNLLVIINWNNLEETQLAELYLNKIINSIIFFYEDKNLDYIKGILDLIINNKKIKTDEQHFKKILFEILNRFLRKFEEILDNKKYWETLKEKIPFDSFPDILKFIIGNYIELNEKEDFLQSADNIYLKHIIKSNTIFHDLMKNVKPKYFESSGFNDIFNIQLLNYLNENSTNLVFDWISQLYTSKIYKNDEFLKNLLIEMKDLKKFQIKRIINVIYMIKSNSSNFSEEAIISKILNKFSDEDFIDEFGFFILDELSDDSNKTIEITDIFKEIANNLKSNYNTKFVSDMIEFLTKYLITGEKAGKIIEALNYDMNLFKKLYKLFCFNPFDTLVLLLLAKKFELSYFLVLIISKMNLDSSDYIELSKAVQIFESYFFIDVRVQLLNPKSNIYLTKTLYAISLLLPPGPALKALSYRLKCLEILYDFDDEEEDENEINIEKDINNDDSSNSISDFEEEENDSLNLIIDENNKKFFNEIFVDLDEKDISTFNENHIDEYIYIFYEKQSIKNKRKNFEI